MAVRRYSRQFKLSAVKLVNHQGYTVAEVAESLGVNEQNIRNWITRFSPEVGKTPIDEPCEEYRGATTTASRNQPQNYLTFMPCMTTMSMKGEP